MLPITAMKSDTRGQVAEALLAAGGALSVQVLNEFVAVARRKLDKSWEEVRRALDLLRIFCPGPAPLTVETHERAVHIAERYGYSIFDSLIIAAALHSGASTLYSEDMQDGQVIEGLTIRNPFAR
jgi:predicted nucleic acid-binding protein